MVGKFGKESIVLRESSFDGMKLFGRDWSSYVVYRRQMNPNRYLISISPDYTIRISNVMTDIYVSLIYAFAYANAFEHRMHWGLAWSCPQMRICTYLYYYTILHPFTMQHTVVNQNTHSHPNIIMSVGNAYCKLKHLMTCGLNDHWELYPSNTLLLYSIPIALLACYMLGRQQIQPLRINYIIFIAS